MTATVESPIEGALSTAEAVLSGRAGTAVSLTDPEDLGGSGRTVVARVRVSRNLVSTHRTLVIKALGADDNPEAFHREVAAYQYATALPSESRPGPQLIAHDPGKRVIVLSDLGTGRAMTDLLASPDVEEVSRAVSAWGQALGRMHAATVGGEGDFDALVRRSRARIARSAPTRLSRRVVAELPAVADSLGVAVPDSVLARLGDAVRLFTDGDFRAFSPADVGPENILINSDGVRFMDYEWGGFRDATLDVAYGLATFPEHLGARATSVRADLETALVDAWRAEAQTMWPALADERAVADLIASARLLWVWLSTVVLVGVGDGPLDGAEEMLLAHDWAIMTTDVVVACNRWQAIADAANRAAESTQGLAELGGFCESFAAALRRNWLS
ncbi:phosphotransferase [Gordonia sp. UBA5067]|uniref:phosphotransferase n=1 Tax=Gordonia sp. UBA5067 TaxID=1946575 RepID=UPI0025B82C6C|nr:phosphotransferase [Gordonia sp. UBA5067]